MSAPKPKITVWLVRHGYVDGSGHKWLERQYVVKKVQNAVDPYVGQLIPEGDVPSLISDGITVNIS